VLNIIKLCFYVMQLFKNISDKNGLANTAINFLCFLVIFKEFKPGGDFRKNAQKKDLKKMKTGEIQ